jgi:hypothetical protein
MAAPVTSLPAVPELAFLLISAWLLLATLSCLPAIVYLAACTCRPLLLCLRRTAAVLAPCQHLLHGSSCAVMGSWAAGLQTIVMWACSSASHITALALGTPPPVLLGTLLGTNLVLDLARELLPVSAGTTHTSSR